jgi:hypothetical protein
MDFHWIRVHWFELSALVLLALNLWFVVKVLSVLKAVQDGLLLLARWLDIARHDIEDQADDGTLLRIRGLTFTPSCCVCRFEAGCFVFFFEEIEPRLKAQSRSPLS